MEALQITIDFNERYAQASTYHQLGRMAQAQRQWDQARDYFLRALPILVEFNDDHNASIVLRSLARLWQASGDTSLPAAIAPILKILAEEAEKLLQDLLPEEE